MPTRICLVCSANLYVKPSHILRGWGKYCSKKCQNQSQMSGTIENCYICNREIYKPQHEKRHSRSGKFFCGKSCQTRWRNSQVFTGSAHGNWKGGESAYRDILMRSNRKKICELCGMSDMRVLAVHHIDKNRKNNSLGNLSWLCFNCHYLIHHDIKEHKGFLKQHVSEQ